MDNLSFDPESPVLVIGAAGLDIVGRLSEALHTKTSNPARIRISFGGVARNVAENLARLGQPVTLLSAVGQDETGQALLEQAASSGVDTSAVLRAPDCPTGSYVGVVDRKGALELAMDDMRAIRLVSPDYLHEHASLFRQASLVFLDANLSKETLRTAFSLARRARVPVCADPTAALLAHRLRPYLSQMLLTTPNSAEADVLCDYLPGEGGQSNALETAKRLVAQGVSIVVITLAEYGLVYATSETSGNIPAIRTEILDPTGAGDALTSAVIFALLNDIPLDDAMRLGVSAATLTLRHPGTVRPDLSLQKLYDELVI